MYDDFLSEDQQVKMVIANSSFAKVFATLAGSITYLRKNTFLYKEILITSLPALVLVVICSYWIGQIEFSKKTFAFIFIILMLPILIKMLIDSSQNNEYQPSIEPKENRTIKLLLLGIIAGIVPSISGLGGGFIMVPVLIYFIGYTINESIAISLGVIFCTSVALSVYYAFVHPVLPGINNAIGAISLGLSLPLVIGVLLAAPLGVKVSNALKPGTIRQLFVVICLIIIGKTIIVDLL